MIRNEVSKGFLEALWLWTELVISFIFTVNSSKPPYTEGPQVPMLSFLIFSLEKNLILLLFVSLFLLLS